MTESLGTLFLNLKADSSDVEKELANIAKLSEQTGAKITAKIKTALGKDLAAEIKRLNELALGTNMKISGKQIGDNLVLTVKQAVPKVEKESKKLGEQIAEGVAQGIKVSIPKIEKESKTAGKKAGQSIGEGILQGIGQAIAGNALGLITGTISGALGIIKSSIQNVLNFANESNQIFNTFQGYRNVLNLVAGDVKKGGEAFKFVTDTAKQLRAPLEESIRGFAKLSAASRGTTLEGEATKNIFLSLALAAKTYNLSGEQFNRLIDASGQIISKGRVQWEELRGQIADGGGLLGAVQIAQRAFGATGKEFENLIRNGVSAEEFFTRFSYQLASETAGGVAGGLKLTTAAAADAANKFLEFRIKLGEAIDPAIKGGYEFLANVLGQIVNKVGGFDSLQQQAQKFANWLNSAQGPSKFIADKIIELGTKGINLVAEYAGKLTEELEKNPGTIKQMVSGFNDFITGLTKAVELAGKIAGFIGSAGSGLAHFSQFAAPKILTGGQFLAQQSPPMQLLTAIRRAIVGQESAGNFRAVNPHSGALGYGQIMPSNLANWTKQALGRAMGKQEFLSNPQAQIRTIETILGGYLKFAMAVPGIDLPTAVRRVAASWYAGPGNARNYNNQRAQYSGGARYPSIAEYTNSVLQRTLQQFGNQQFGPAMPAGFGGSASGSGSLVFPVAGMNYANARFSSEFGMRVHPVTGERKMHRGLDIPAAKGTAVLAPMEGIVKRVFWDTNGGGNVVVVESYDAQGRVLTHKFLHLSAFAVKEGDRVKAGQRVGSVGNTGTGTGPHLHYGAMLGGEYINPREVLSGRLKFNAIAPGSASGTGSTNVLGNDVNSRIAAMKVAADAAAARAAADRARAQREEGLRQGLDLAKRSLEQQHQLELARFDNRIGGLGESDRGAAGFLRQRIQRRQELESTVQGFSQASTVLELERAKKIREGVTGGRDLTADINFYRIQIENAKRLYELQTQSIDAEARRVGIRVNLEQAETKLNLQQRADNENLQDTHKLEGLILEQKQGQTDAAKALFQFEEQRQQAAQTRQKAILEIRQQIQSLELKQFQEASGVSAKSGVDYNAEIARQRARIGVVEEVYNRELSLIERNRQARIGELARDAMSGAASVFQSANQFRLDVGTRTEVEDKRMNLQRQRDALIEDFKNKIKQTEETLSATGPNQNLENTLQSLRNGLKNVEENYRTGVERITAEEAKRIADLIQTGVEDSSSVLDKAAEFRASISDSVGANSEYLGKLKDLQSSYEEVADAIAKQLEALNKLQNQTGESLQIDEQKLQLNYELTASVEAYQKAREKLAQEEKRRTDEAAFQFAAGQSQIRGQISTAIAGRLRLRGRGVAANNLERAVAVEAEQYRFQGEIRQLQELHRTGQLTNAQLVEAKANAEALNQVNLNNLSDQFNLLNQALEPLKSNFQQFFQDIFSGSKSLGNSLKDLFKGILNNLLSLATQTLTNQLFSGIMGGNQGAGGGGGFLGKILGGLFGGSGGGGFLGGLFGGGKSGLGLLGHVLPFAEGGIVTRPTLGLVGESGAEAIIPLNRVPSLSGSGGTVNISIPISINASGSGGYEQLKRELRAEIEPVAVRVMQRQKRPGGILA